MTKQTIGNTVEVCFTSISRTPIRGKVDTGATTSSLHATNIKVDERMNTVSFVSPELSPNVIKLTMVGHQEVHSADAGGEHRPLVELDVTVDGVQIKQAQFNLNDRSNMDTHLLVGQNVLQAGGFLIDPGQSDTTDSKDHIEQVPDVDRDSRIQEAINVLLDCDVSLNEFVQYMKTAAITSLRDD